MKNKSLELGLSDFFRQRSQGKDISDHIPEWVRPESEWEKSEGTIIDILRWADDGGKLLELRSQKDRSNLDAARAQVKEAEQEYFCILSSQEQFDDDGS